MDWWSIPSWWMKSAFRGREPQLSLQWETRNKLFSRDLNCVSCMSCSQQRCWHALCHHVERSIQGLTATGQWGGLAISWTPATPFSLPEAQQWIIIYSKCLHCSSACHILEFRVYQIRSHLSEVGCLVSAGADARSHETQTLFVLGFQALTLFWSWLQLRKETSFCYLHSPSHTKNLCTWKLVTAKHICTS